MQNFVPGLEPPGGISTTLIFMILVTQQGVTSLIESLLVA